MKETPNATTPWPSINRLLKADERYRSDVGTRSYLFAPKLIATLEALHYACHEEGLTPNAPDDRTIVISTRALTRTDTSAIDQGTVTVEAGALVADLERSLYELGYRTGWTSDPAIAANTTVGGAVRSGWLVGDHIDGIPFDRRLLQVQVVTANGGQAPLGVNGLLSAGIRSGAFATGVTADVGTLAQVQLAVAQGADYSRCWVWKGENASAAVALWRECYRCYAAWQNLDIVFPPEGEGKVILVAQTAGNSDQQLADLHAR